MVVQLIIIYVLSDYKEAGATSSVEALDSIPIQQSSDAQFQKDTEIHKKIKPFKAEICCLKILFNSRQAEAS